MMSVALLVLLILATLIVSWIVLGAYRSTHAYEDARDEERRTEMQYRAQLAEYKASRMQLDLGRAWGVFGSEGLRAVTGEHRGAAFEHRIQMTTGGDSSVEAKLLVSTTLPGEYYVGRRGWGPYFTFRSSARSGDPAFDAAFHVGSHRAEHAEGFVKMRRNIEVIEALSRLGFESIEKRRTSYVAYRRRCALPLLNLQELISALDLIAELRLPEDAIRGA